MRGASGEPLRNSVKVCYRVSITNLAMEEEASASAQCVNDCRPWKVDPSAECPVCLQVYLRRPVELRCGHLLCIACLDRLGSHEYCTCPVCRRPSLLNSKILAQRRENFRRGYSAWRRGESKGAKGTVADISRPLLPKKMTKEGPKNSDYTLHDTVYIEVSFSDEGQPVFSEVNFGGSTEDDEDQYVEIDGLNPENVKLTEQNKSVSTRRVDDSKQVTRTSTSPIYRISRQMQALLSPILSSGATPLTPRYSLMRRAPQSQEMSSRTRLVRTPVTRAGKCTMPQATVNCVNYMLGLCMLSYAFSVSKVGWISGVLLLFLAAVTTWVSARIFGSLCCEAQRMLKCQEITYSDLGYLAMGSFGRSIVHCFQNAELLTFLVMSLISMAQTLSHLLAESSSTNTLIFAIALAVLPTCFLDDLRPLSLLSSFGLVASVAMLAAVVKSSFDGPSKTENYPSTTLFPPEGATFATFLSTTSLMYAGFSAHAVLPTVWSSMERKSDFNRVVDITYIITIACFGCIATCGYLTFGDNVKPILLLNIHRGWIASVVQIAIVVVCYCKFALMLNPVALNFFNVLRSKRIVPRGKWGRRGLSMVLRAILVFGCATAAALAGDFAFVGEICGAIFSVTLCIVFPLIFFVSIFWGKLSVISKFIICFGIALAVALSVLMLVFDVLEGKPCR